MNKFKNIFKSVRVKLFVSLCIIVILIVLFLITINNVVLESFYLYSKVEDVKKVYAKVNQYYSENVQINIDEQLNNIATKNNIEILIKNEENLTLYSSDKNLTTAVDKMNELILNNRMINSNDETKNIIIYKTENITIRKIVDLKNSINFIFLSGKLDNGNMIYIRIPISSIQESVKISNNLLVLVGAITIIIAGIMASILSRKFTDPITELNDIATNMSKLDFSKKYIEKDTNDEINNLGKSINLMSQKLEATIKQLRENNIELEKDIEEKSKIDEMRKQFISDVSHELKTPIALIQGYAEGLVENVNVDEESRKFYAEVILDETSKMDTLVKQLLELMKLEYGKREFNNIKFDIVELINEVIRRCKVMLEEKNITVQFDYNEPQYVIADEFYIDQVVTNYFTNAIKHAEEINGKKEIVINLEERKENKLRINIFNTGKNIQSEDLDRIWKRFYKVDSSRNRDDGGTGIGLSLVKAIMNNYNEKYGVKNRENGVEFYFELSQK
jgi:signal transduction histidine kinase